MLPRGSRKKAVYGTLFHGLDLYCTDPAQQLMTAGKDLPADDLDLDLSDLSDVCHV